MVIDQARGIVRGTPFSSDAGHTYSFQVNVFDKTGAIALNANTYSIAVQTLVPPDATPAAFAATNVTDTGFTAHWGSVDNAAGYWLDISTSSSFAFFTHNRIVNAISANIPGLASNTTYYYRVAAYNGAGISSYSSTIKVTTKALLSPLAPSLNAPTIGWGPWFRGTWTAVSGAAGYRLDVYTSLGYVSGYQNRDVGNVTSWDITGLNPSTTYSYRVRAYNGANTYSTYSNVVTTTTSSIVRGQMLTPTPASFNSNGAAFTISDTIGATFTSSTVTFSWKAGVNVTEYYLNVGNTLGAGDIYGASQGLNLSRAVSIPPTDGRTIYVTLLSKIGGLWYRFNYPYKALKSSAPNLTPYQPSGWSNKIVTTHTYGSKTDTSSLVATSPIYIDFAFINNGVSNVTTAFRTNLYVDNVQRTYLPTSSLSVNTWIGYIGYSIGLLSHGSHTIKITTDSTNQVSESNESDNTYTKTIFVN